MLELQRNLYVLRRWWWLLIAAAIVGGLVAYGLTKVLVKQSYVATAMVSVAPAPAMPNAPYTSLLAAGTDAQLVQTLSTAQLARQSLPPADAAQVDAATLSGHITGTSSPEGELLYIAVKWPTPDLVPMLANTVARVFIQQERSRLESRYVIIHRGLAAQEQHLANLMGLASGNGPADSWLRAQYADAAAKLYEEDTGARIQASNQEASLDIAQPATTAVATGTKASTNAVLGAILAFLVASLIVFVATTAYPRAEAADAVRPVLTKVGE